MPLSVADADTSYVITRVGGNEKTRLFLENLGFVTGATVMIVSKIEGNLIVNIKETRVALDKDLASKVFV